MTETAATASPASRSDSDAPGPLARALRIATAFPIYLVLATAITIAVTLLAGLTWLARDAWLFAAIGVATAAVLSVDVPPPRRIAGESPRARRIARATWLLLCLAVVALFLSTGGRRDELGWALAAAAAAILGAWAGRFRRSVMGPGGGLGPGELLLWIAGFLAIAWFVDGLAIVVILLLQLVRQTPLLAALARGPARPLALTVSLALVAAAIFPFRRSFEAEPTPCQPVGERPAYRDPDARWIVTLGDSTTQGIFHPERLTYPGVLQERLADEPGAPFRVANCAFSGARSDQVMGQLERGLELDPEFVTICIGDNDTLLEANFDSIETHEARQKEIFDAWRERTVAVIDASRAAGAEPILVVPLNGLAFQGDFTLRLREETLALGEQEGVAVVDSQAEAERRSAAAFHVIADFVHPNQLGHALMAELIAEAVRREAAGP